MLRTIAGNLVPGVGACVYDARRSVFFLGCVEMGWTAACGVNCLAPLLKNVLKKDCVLTTIG